MTRYRKVECKIWTDADVEEASFGCQWLLFYILTSPDMTAIGAMRSTADNVRILSRYSEGPFKEVFAEAFREGIDLGFWEYDERGVIWLPKFLQHNRPQSANVVKSWRTVFDTLPNCPLKVRLDHETKVFLEQNLGDSFVKAYEKPCPKPKPKAKAKPKPKTSLIQETGYRNQESGEREGASVDADPALFSLIDGWNDFANEVGAPTASKDPPGKAVLAGWKKANALGNEALWACFEDRDKLFEKLRAAKWLHGKGYLALDWLFGEGKTGELNAVKILEGRFEDREPFPRNGQARDRTLLPAGQRVGRTL